MAARIRRIRHDESTRLKIQASQLVNRLQGHALGEIELTATQIQAAKILLDKSLPNLTQTDLKGEVDVQVSGWLQVLRHADGKGD